MTKRVYKMTKEHKRKIVESNRLTNLRTSDSEKKQVIPFQQEFWHISPQDLEEILEWLGDNKYLSDAGKTFRTRFWELFIKE